jgi:selenide,water dikinase
MCQASGVGAEVGLDSVPVLDGVTDLLARGMWAGGSQRNLRSIQPDLTTDRDIDDWKPLIDAQTSGGLLVALPEGAVSGYTESVRGAVRIGTVTSDKLIRVT